MRKRIVRLLLLAALAAGALGGSSVPPASAQAGCGVPYTLPGSALKDHSLFAFDGWYYLVGIRIALPKVDDRGELDFAYARTRDFCAWETLASPLGHGAPGEPDEAYVWAPHVIRVGDTFYMYYTGVNRQIAQTIMLATSTNPADPASWQKRGAVFRPDHPGAVYPGPGAWSDCRDPMVLAHEGRYYLYYTGTDEDGPIVGVAMAASPTGPWRDLGAVYRAAEPGEISESPFVVEQGGVYYLFTNGGGRVGERWRWSVSPFGPWQASDSAGVGWAHDFYRDEVGWIASYVLGDGRAIGVERVRWQEQGFPPAPRLGLRVYLPFAAR